MSTPPPDLTEAEHWLRDCADDETRSEADWPSGVRGPATVLLAEYDRRHRAISRLLALCGDYEVAGVGDMPVSIVRHALGGTR